MLIQDYHVGFSQVLVVLNNVLVTAGNGSMIFTPLATNAILNSVYCTGICYMILGENVSL